MVFADDIVPQTMIIKLRNNLRDCKEHPYQLSAQCRETDNKFE